MDIPKKLAFFLDYDGTLTPIVSRPEQALLTHEQREILRRLSEKFPVAIISGRDRKDVEALVGLPRLYYAGCHGFDIGTPEGKVVEIEDAYSLDLAEEALEDLKEIPGILLERKKYAIAIHYRQCDPLFKPQIETKVREVESRFPDLLMMGGKMVFELRPSIDRDKGKAVFKLMDLMGLDDDICPVFIGDDTTDEDAFLALKGRGITIKVGGKQEKTGAEYHLSTPGEVYKFLLSFI